jgi:hypothetical protein
MKTEIDATYKPSSPRPKTIYGRLVAALILYVVLRFTAAATAQIVLDSQGRPTITDGSGTHLLIPAGAFPPRSVSFPPGQVVRDFSVPSQQVVSAVPLTSAVVPGGDFGASVPRGWSIRSSPQGDGFQIVSPGGSQVSAWLVIVDVSDLRYRAQLTSCSRGGFNPFGNMLTQCTIPSIKTQLGDSSREWSPAEGLQSIIAKLQGTNAAGRFGMPTVSPVSNSRASAFFRVEGRRPKVPSSAGESSTWSTCPIPCPIRGQ